MSESHYELSVRRKNGGQWTLEIATDNRERAIQAAEDLLAEDRGVAVRVSKETRDPETGDYKSVVVFTKGAVDGGRPAKPVSNRPPLCSEPADLYTPNARERLGRVLEGWLTRNRATPFELLHRPDLVAKLEASGTDLQHALQKVAIPEAEARGQTVHEVIRHFQGLVERATADLRAALRKNPPPDLDQEGFSRAAERLVENPERAFLLGAGVAASIAPAESWSDKVARLLDLADAAPKDGPARAMALTAVEQPLVEIITSKAGLNELLDITKQDLGVSLLGMVRLAGGAPVEALAQLEPGVSATLPTLSDVARRLSKWLDGGDFSAARKIIAAKVFADLNGVRRLRPNDAEAEIECLRCLAMSLTAAEGRVLTSEEVQIAYTTRSKALIGSGFIDALLGRDRSALEDVRMLVRLTENVIGPASKRHAARWLSANLGASRFEYEMLQGADSPAVRLSQLAVLQRAVARSGLVPEDYTPLCDKLGEIGARIEADARLLTMLARAPMPPQQRLALLVKYATGQTGPTGAVADRARSEVLKMARDPALRDALARAPEVAEMLKTLAK